MAIQNFIKTVWEANLMLALRKTHVFASVANQQYRGTLKALGDKVKIVQVADVTINSYSRATNLTRQVSNDAAIELTADQAYYFNIDVDDVDAVQEKSSILSAIMDNGAYGFRDTADQYFAGLYAQAGLTSYSTGTTPSVLTKG